jgi:sodium/potassium-transporting ATPase subunit alpha
VYLLDLGFELFIALSFAWDKPETDGVMRLGPRKPVTEHSVMNLKRRALRRTKTLARDPETGEIIQPPISSKLKEQIMRPFTRQFWEDKFEKSDGETLVDNKVLSYAYLEAGMIEAAGL